MADIQDNPEDEDYGLNMVHYESNNSDENDDKFKKLIKDPSIAKKKNGRYSCRLCSYRNNEYKHLLRHYLTHVPPQVEKYKCHICKKTFETNNELISHKEEHEKEDRSFICKTCKLAFTDHCDWLQHEVTHLSRLLYKCRECARYFSLKLTYENHIATHYKPRFTCNICNKKCSTNKALEIHLNVHSSKHTCCECGRCFEVKKYLEYHMISHTGVKMHQCLYCGKGFSNTAQLTTHTRIHTNERPFECTACHRRFRQTIDRSRHACKEKVLEKKYQCDICKRNFLHKESIVTHLKIHTNDRQFVCDNCGAGCITKSALQWHKLHKHSGAQHVSCDVPGCSYTTSYRHHIRRHKKNVHKIDI